MAELILKPVEIAIEHLVNGTKVQYRYLFRFRSFMNELDEQVDNLMSTRERVKSRVVNARRNDQIIYADVKKWLRDVQTILNEAQSLKDEINNKKGCFMGRRCWYRSSKKIEKTTFHIIKLQKNGESFKEVSPGRAPLSIPFIISKDFTLSKSSKAALGHIMDGLKDESANMIGLYGMGGVGKTTLAEKVAKLAKDLNLFDKVVMVVVSQTPDFMDIQDNVAAALGLNFESEKDMRTKASRLYSRLENEKNILIILDDIWNFLDLARIGISFGADNKGCKLFLTTRHRHVCSSMKCEKEIHLDVMCETEAWDLFKERAGLDDMSPVIDTAIKVAKECKGLPIAIVTLARALRNNTTSQWQDALMYLKESRRVEIENIEDENAYKCLKVSYDRLKGETIKLCFLMCALYPEDHDIEIELLARHAWGLGGYVGAGSIEEGRIRVQSSVDHLKDYCLLIDSGTNKVKMHDVVRHFALWIASNQENFFTARYIERSNRLIMTIYHDAHMAISLKVNAIEEIPSGLVCRNVKIFLVDGDRTTRISETFFEQMRTLEVLTITRCCLSPHLLGILINLKALHLEFCKVGDISSLGKLKSLEILSFMGSDIHELPDEIGEMKDLKLLDLSSCSELERIPAGLIQKLSRLEELYIYGSKYNPWEARLTTDSRGKARLSELNSLSQLTVLSLDYKVEILPDTFVLPNLTRYEIFDVPLLNTRRQWISSDLPRGYFPNPIMRAKFPTTKTLTVELVNDTSFIAFKRLLPTVEHFSMNTNNGILCIVPEIEPGGFNSLVSLTLTSSMNMLCLVDTKGENVPTTAFNNLKRLNLSEMKSLREVSRGRIPNRFLQKLETLLLYDCPELSSIFQVQKELKREESMLFSRLLELKLKKLPKLSSVWEGLTQHVSLHSLTTVELERCCNLTSIFSPSMVRTLVHLQCLKISDCDELECIFKEEENNNESSTSHGHLFLTSLKEVSIQNCNKLKYVFPNIVAPSCCQQLQKLCLEYNMALEQIFKYGQGTQMDIELSHLENLTILGSQRQVKFAGGYCSTFSFPSLQILCINMRVIQSPPRLEAYQLQQLHLSRLPKEWWHNNLSQLVGDLQDLRELKLENLEGVEEVIQLEVDEERSDLVLPIKYLTLDDLPQLTHIWKCPSYTSLLQNLIKLNICSCDTLSYIFPPALAQNLPMLKSFKVKYCNNLMQIIGSGEEGDQNHLKVMSFPNLKKIAIESCDNIEFLFPPSLIGGFPKLRELQVEDTDGLKQIFGSETSKAKNNKPEEDAVYPIPSLRDLLISNCAVLCPLRLEAKQLRRVQLKNVPKEWWQLLAKELRQLSGDLPTLVSLDLDSLEGLEEVIGLEGGEERSDLVLPIESLTLEKLPQLAHIWKCPSYTGLLQTLTWLFIYSCDKLSYIFPPTLAQNLPMLNWLIVDDCNEVVQMIGNNEEEGDPNHLEITSFPNLAHISIRNCNKMKYLFPVSVVHGLPKLSRMEVEGGDALEHIFGNGMLEAKKDTEEVARFRILEQLSLKQLPSFTGLSVAGYTYEFPSMTELTVEGCSNMTKSFTVLHSGGYLRTE